MGSISQFIDRHFRHFNAAVLKDAADAYTAHLKGGRRNDDYARRGNEHR